MTLRERLAWGVHVYTGIGSVLAFLGLIAIYEGHYSLAFIWMAVATFIDATDGTLARRVRVKEVLPQFDGARLDDIVDYMNYVLVPVVLAYHAGLVPPNWIGLVACGAPLLASGYGFGQTSAKTPDHFFTGFPSYWNIVVFYYYVLGTPPWFNVALLILFAIMVFVPIRYLYPSRNPFAQKTTYILGGLWGVAMFTLMFQMPAPSSLLAWLSLLFPAYYMGLSFYAHFRLPAAHSS